MCSFEQKIRSQTKKQESVAHSKETKNQQKITSENDWWYKTAVIKAQRTKENMKKARKPCMDTVEISIDRPPKIDILELESTMKWETA